MAATLFQYLNLEQLRLAPDETDAGLAWMS